MNLWTLEREIQSAQLFVRSKRIMFSSRARSFVTIMIVIALSALLLRMGISRLIIFNIEQNQFVAQSNIKLLSAALESFAKANKGQYPTQISQLTQASPAYLEKDYILASPLKGYEYDCPRLDPAGFNCQAMPEKCQFTGKKVFSVSTEGLTITEDCEKNSDFILK